MFVNTTGSNNHHIKRSDVVLDPSGQVYIHIHSSKTIQYQQRVLVLPLPFIKGHPLCPVTALKHAFSLGPIQSGNSPVFSYPTPVGCKNLTYNVFVKELRKILSRSGHSDKHYSGHSFRRGGACFALKVGISGEIIKLLGDWRSDTYQRYLDTSVQTRLQAVTTLAKSLPTTPM